MSERKSFLRGLVKTLVPAAILGGVLLAIPTGGASLFATALVEGASITAAAAVGGISTGALSTAAVSASYTAYNGIKFAVNCVQDQLEEDDEVYIMYEHLEKIGTLGEVVSFIPDGISDLSTYVGLRLNHAYLRITNTRGKDKIIEVTGTPRGNYEELAKNFSRSGQSHKSGVSVLVYAIYREQPNSTSRKSHLRTSFSYGKVKKTMQAIKQKAKDLLLQKNYDYLRYNCQDFAKDLANYCVS